MFPHKPIVTAGFAIAGLHYGYIVVRDFDSILAAHRAFFDGGVAWLANVSAAAIALVPLAFFATGAAVHRDSKWWAAAIPAAIALLMTLGISSIALGAYLALYYTVLKRRNDAAGVS